MHRFYALLNWVLEMEKLNKQVFSTLSFLVLTSCIQNVYAAEALASNSQWMLGDWKGKRTELSEKGYEFNVNYTGEYAAVLDAQGASRHGAEYSDQFALGAHFDLQKILNWQDTEAQITITERNGRSLSQTSAALDRHLGSVQEIWGRGQTWRLTDLWIKKKFLNQTLDIKAGRFGESEDFNSFDCDFQNLALCGSQVGIWANDQWYNWPVSQWAARVKYNIQPNLYAQIGAYEYNPENLKRGKGFNLSTNGAHGVMIPVELVWMPTVGVQQLPGEYHLGYYQGTAGAEVISDTTKTNHKHGAWFMAKQQFTTYEGDVNRGLSGFVQLTLHDAKTNNITNTQNLGLVYKGLFNARPKDEIALGFARISVNDDVNKNKIEKQYEEYNAELYYGIHATDWLTIRPNVQYIRHVGAYKEGENVWVGGIKFSTNF